MQIDVLQHEPGQLDQHLGPGPEGAAVLGAVEQQQHARQAGQDGRPVLPLQAQQRLGLGLQGCDGGAAPWGAGTCTCRQCLPRTAHAHTLLCMQV